MPLRSPDFNPEVDELIVDDAPRILGGGFEFRHTPFVKRCFLSLPASSLLKEKPARIWNVGGRSDRQKMR
jgi:hypothetical protein